MPAGRAARVTRHRHPVAASRRGRQAAGGGAYRRAPGPPVPVGSGAGAARRRRCRAGRAGKPRARTDRRRTPAGPGDTRRGAGWRSCPTPCSTGTFDTLAVLPASVRLAPVTTARAGARAKWTRLPVTGTGRSAAAGAVPVNTPRPYGCWCRAGQDLPGAGAGPRGAPLRRA